MSTTRKCNTNILKTNPWYRASTDYCPHLLERNRVLEKSLSCYYLFFPGVDCARGWLSRGSSSCYYISSGNKNDSVTWFEAKDRCNDLVASVNLIAYRLAVNSKDEQVTHTLLHVNLVDLRLKRSRQLSLFL